MLHVCSSPPQVLVVSEAYDASITKLLGIDMEEDDAVPQPFTTYDVAILVGVGKAKPQRISPTCCGRNR
jgi:hypothetical protein